MHGGTDRAANTSESLSLLYSFPLLSPELYTRLSRAGEVGRREAEWSAGGGRQDPARSLSCETCHPEPAEAGTPRHPRPGPQVQSAAQPQAPPGPRPRSSAAWAGWGLSAVGGKSSLMLTGPLPSGQVCSAPLPLPVWKPLQP